MKKFFKVTLRFFAYFFVLILVLLGLALCSLLFFEHSVPKSILKRLTACCSTSDFLVHVDSATFRFSHGIKLQNVRVLDKGRRYGEKNGPIVTVLSASEVDLELDLRALLWSRASALRAVTLTDLRYPRLPRGYYIPDSIEFPGQPDFREVDEPLNLELPELRPFGVKLIRPEILGVVAPWVEVQSVESTARGLRAVGIRLRWPDTDDVMHVDGGVVLDLGEQWLHGDVRGQARQHNIRPMLEALDITNSYQFIDAFTKVEKPVDTTCSFDVNLRNNDLRLLLDLHPRGGAYNGVPLQRVDGKLDIRVFVRDHYQNARIVVGPLLGTLADGSKVEGTVVYENTNDVGFVNFDVATHAPMKDVLAIADVWTDGTLDCIAVTNGVPTVTLRGRLAVDDAYAATNDLRGTIAFTEGSLLGIPLRRASTAFSVKGTTVDFTEAVAQGPQGGMVKGVGTITVPESRRDLASFGVKIAGRSMTVGELAQVLNLDSGDKQGTVSVDLDLQGPLYSGTNGLMNLVGKGHIECRDGRLARMKLFAGLTDYLARHVPGVSDVVDLSRSTQDFTLKNGIVSSTNIVVEGNVISVRAEGGYDIPNDRLDFRARVALTKNDSLLGKLATPITWPFSNLAQVLLDFGIHGSLDDPTWTYSRNPLGLLPVGKER